MIPTFTIDDAIAFYEEEENSLKKMISDSLEEDDFLIAKYHTTALRMLQQKLFHLNCLKDSAYQEKHRSKMRLLNMEKMLSSDKFLEFRSSTLKHIEEEKIKLHELNLINTIKENKEGEDLIKLNLIDLFNNQIKGLTIVIDDNKGLKLKLKKEGGKLQMSIPEVKKVLPEFIQSDYYSAKFTKLGFEYSKNKLIFSSPIEENFDNYANTIMMLLSVLCIDIFDVAVKKLNSFLVVKEK